MNLITGDDIAALTHESAGISGIRYVMDAGKDEVEKILNSRGHGSRHLWFYSVGWSDPNRVRRNRKW